MRKYAYIGAILYCILLIPPVRIYLESIMVVHMLVQLTLLIIAGWFLGKYLVNRFPKLFDMINSNGVPGIILVICITLYWMLPRAADEALTLLSVEIFKFISLPIVGILLADSWEKIKTLGRSFVFLNYLSMFGMMGWLYLDAPIQICNNYLISEQKALGIGYLIVTAAMILYVLQYVFVDHSQD
jgi:hypothetical protein